MNRHAQLETWLLESRWRCFLLFVLLMVLPIVFFALSAARVLKDQAEKQAVTESTQIGRVTSTLIEEHFRQSTAFLQSFATRPTVGEAFKQGDLSALQRQLQQAIVLRPDFGFVSVFDVKGTMQAIYPPNRGLLGQNFAYRDWFRGVSREGKPYISEVYQTAASPNQLVVGIAVPIEDQPGRPIGVFMATFAVDTISRWLSESRIDGAWNISLVDQHGQLSAYPNMDSFSPAVNLSVYEPVQQIRANRAGNGIFVRDGKRLVVHYEPMQANGWGVLVEQPVGVLAEGTWAIERRLWLLGAVFLAVGLGVSGLMGSLYSRLSAGNRFMNLSVDMFCVAGADGFFKHVSPAWERNLGFTVKELMAKPYLEFIHPDDRAASLAEKQHLHNGEVTLSFENRYQCKNGSYRWFLWNAVCDPKQNLIYAAARDITERKGAEERVRESEERYRMLFELNPQPVWAYDRQTLRFLAVNQAAVSNYGYSRDEFLAMTIRDIRPRQDVPAVIESVSSLKDGEQQLGIWRHCKRDGSVIDVEITSYAFSFGGRAADLVIAVDITDRKRGEEERHRFTESLGAANRELEVRNRELERATQMKSKFLASMSHELRTPLNAIVGFSGLLAEHAAGPLNEKQERFVAHIKQGADHLLQLINDILDLSKIEAGQLEFRCEDFFLQDALPEVLSTIRPLAMVKNIRVEHELQAGCCAYADRIRVKQVLYNLFSNAVKFTPKGGQINIDCSTLEGCVRVSVSDTGIGIPSEDQEVIFQEFRQLEGKGHVAGEGTGLGLAITKCLVEQQGGKIWVESEVGKGSCFSFTLPAGRAISPPSPVISPIQTPEAAPAAPYHPQVLVVDDEIAARELIASYLEPDYRVAMAGSGAEAIRKAKELRPDAITLDVLMAGGSGFEILVSLRKDPATASIPVIIVSVVDQKRVGFALGADDYLIKPIARSTLLETIRKCTRVPGGDRPTLLVVDDDAAAIELLENILRSAGHHVCSAQSGPKALQMLDSVPVNGILLDLLMPGMDGFQVICHVRQNARLKGIPIFVMTAKDLTADELSILRRETQALFHKNGSWQNELIENVGRMIRGRAQATKAGGR